MYLSCSTDVTCAGFAAGVEEFEGWAVLLLLDALQRSSLLRAGDEPASLAQLQSRMPAGYARFMAEAIDLLTASGRHLYLLQATTPSKWLDQRLCHSAALNVI